MANKQINQLPADTALTATDKFAIQEAGGTTKNVTGQMISDFVESNLPTPPTGDNIYNSNGTIETDRIVEVDDKSLTFRSKIGVEGAIFFDLDSEESGVEYVSGTIPTGDYGGVPQKSTSGSGIDAQFYVTYSGDVYAYLFGIPGNFSSGSGYEVGDTIILSGANLGGVDGIDDMTIIVTKLFLLQEFQIKVNDTVARIGYGSEEFIPGGVIPAFGKSDPPSIEVQSYTGTVIMFDGSVTQDSTSGSGIDAEFSIYVDDVDGLSFGNPFILNGGSGYEVGDTITILGSQIGGTDGVDDIVFEVLVVTVEIVEFNGNKVETVETGVNITGPLVTTDAITIIENTNRYELNVTPTGSGDTITVEIDPVSDNLDINASSGLGSSRYIQSSYNIRKEVRSISYNQGSTFSLDDNINMNVLNNSDVSVALEFEASTGIFNIKFGNEGILTLRRLDSQKQVTTDASPTTGAVISNGFDSQIVTVKAIVTALNSDNSKAYFAELTGAFKTISGVLSQIGTTELLEKTQFTTATSRFNISAGVTTIQVIGEAATNITWTVTCEYTIQ